MDRNSRIQYDDFNNKANSIKFAVAKHFQQDFSDGYTYKIFGLGNKESILVGKSPFVGVQISKTDKEFMIQGTPPTFAGGIFVFFTFYDWYGLFSIGIKEP